jgi:Helix-turn-helix domain
MNDLLTSAQAAFILRKHPNTLAQWRMWNRGPRFQKKGRRVFYARSDVERFKRGQS